jgi:hypothetical protein
MIENRNKLENAAQALQGLSLRFHEMLENRHPLLDQQVDEPRLVRGVP